MIQKVILCLLITIAAAQAAVARGSVNYIFDLPTCQTPGKNILLFDNGHRYFDPVKHTTNVNIALGYGITGNWDVTVARSFKNMDIVGSTKVTLFDDYPTEGNFFSLALAAGGGYKEDSEDVLAQKDQASYFGQLIIQKHFFANRISIGVVPTYAYNTNFYGFKSRHDTSAGFGAFLQIYISDKISVCGEAITNVYGFAFKYMTYNAGFKYAAYRHTFAIWAGNSGGYSPVEYSTGSTELKPKTSFAFTREFDL